MIKEKQKNHNTFKLIIELNLTMTETPNHVGIIMDGNRRFAKRLMLKPWKGHEWGAQKVRRMYEWCQEIGVSELTLYSFSIENFNRPKNEFDYLMNLFSAECERLLHDDSIMANNIRMNFIGRLHLFPQKLQAQMQEF